MHQSAARAASTPLQLLQLPLLPPPPPPPPPPPAATRLPFMRSLPERLPAKPTAAAAG